MALEFVGKDGRRIISKRQLVRRSGADLYRAWQGLARWPRFMPFLTGVLQEGTRSRWQLRDGDEWEMEEIRDNPGRSMVWRSVRGSSAPTAVLVRFGGTDHPGTSEVQLTWRFDASVSRPPSTYRNAALAIDECLEVFRILMEVHPVRAPAVQVGLLT